jgi:hypothetical protein
MSDNQNVPMPQMDHSISLSEASTMTAAWRNNHSGETKAVLFNKASIQSLLNQTGCEGMRIYFAETATGEVTAVLVGADSSENDMYTGTLLDVGKRCPTECPPNNPLNT